MVRDNRGRFLKGVSGNPGGRPKPPVPVEMLIDKTISETDWQDIITKLMAMAKHGNIRAIEILLDRRFGKPIQKQELTGSDGGAIPVELFQHAVKQVYGGD